ncbi:hypothetical protein [Marinomonas spartinae]|uniref:hypothetical protein n=1 Tax=Marinomonas spartinae TaxID=1792290 RepID=UPI0018F1F6BA|nr:hypothetical protein [Marinomonas spartinae]MBJ7554855.1 hypothetical protein [Marinomonas spartinae]
MLSERELVAHHSVIELHQWIQDVFTGDSKHSMSLEKLLNSFSPTFSMVPVSGNLVGLQQVEALFRQNIGSRPSLSITIEQCETLLETQDSIVIRYREVHQEEDKGSSRWSVVIIDMHSGNPLWRYLQETAEAL